MALWYELSQGVADAVKDIREKVVEEPMYGRTLHGAENSPHWPEAEPKQAFGSIEQSKKLAPPEQDRGIDR